MSENFINLITNLVGIKSPSRYEADAVAYLVNWMNAHSFEAYVDGAGNAVGHRGNGKREIILLGHIDTFPGDVPLRRKGQTLYGRGSVDAKGALCTFAAAVSQVIVPKGWRLTVVGAVEEETSGSKGARFRLTQSDSAPQFCIIGEPSRWHRLTLGYKGRLLLDVQLRVPFSHSAGEQPLPAEQGVLFWENILAYAENINAKKSTLFSRLQTSLQKINSADEGAFGKVNLEIGFRLPVDIDPHQLETDLRQLVSSQFGDMANLSFRGHEFAHRASKSTPLVRAFLRAIRAEGETPKFVLKTGTSDMNVVAPVWQCPTLAYGPGDSNLDHTPNEHLNLDEYLRAIAVLRQTLTFLMTD